MRGGRTMNPVFVEKNPSYVKYDYLFQDLPVEFQKCLLEGRKVTTKDLKKMLKRLFPNTKFHIRKNSYSGGSSVNIYYLDGVAKEEVEKVLNWDTEGFDGMTDLSYSKKYRVLMPDAQVRNLEFEWYGYIFVKRGITKENLEKFLKENGYKDVEVYEIGFYIGNKTIGKEAHIKANDINLQYEIMKKLAKTSFNVVK